MNRENALGHTSLSSTRCRRWALCQARSRRKIKRQATLVARLQIVCPARMGAQHAAPLQRQKLLEFFGHYRELQLRLGQGLYYGGFGVFRRSVAGGGHFADQQIL